MCLRMFRRRLGYRVTESVLVNTKLEDTTFVATETPTPRCQ